MLCYPKSWLVKRLRQDNSNQSTWNSKLKLILGLATCFVLFTPLSPSIRSSILPIFSSQWSSDYHRQDDSEVASMQCKHQFHRSCISRHQLHQTVDVNDDNCDFQLLGCGSQQEKLWNKNGVFHHGKKTSWWSHPCFSYWLGMVRSKKITSWGFLKSSSSVGFGSVGLYRVFLGVSRLGQNIHLHKSTPKTQVACCLNPGNGMGLEISLDVSFVTGIPLVHLQLVLF